MSRNKQTPNKAAEQEKVESQPDTKPAEDNVIPLGKTDDEVKEQQNDQTGNEPGLANALLDQVEGRKDSQLALEDAEHPAPESDPAVAPTHQEITDSVADNAAKDALAIQAERADNVKSAFVAETRGERLDTFQPQRIENVRILVESNDHLDRSGNNVTEGTDKIVMSDGVDEARMIDVQPEGQVDDEFDLGNGIRQTNLR